MRIPGDRSTSAMPFCAMAVMGKASIPGRAKSRLVPLLTADGAAAMNTAFLQDIIANLYTASQAAPIVPYVAYGPAAANPSFASNCPRVSASSSAAFRTLAIVCSAP